MDKSTEKAIAVMLLEMGIQPHHSGYAYARTAIGLVLVEPALLHKKVTSDLYPGVAIVHRTTPSKVERAIRFAIEQAFENKSPRWHQVIGRYDYSLRPPTNSFFLAQCAEVLRLDLAS